MASMNVILAPYFTKDIGYAQHDSRNGGKGGTLPNDYDAMGIWYESVKALGLHAFIFHNELSEAFISKYETDKIKFVGWQEHNRPSYNDERFFAYYSFLSGRPEIHHVFCTDLFDVQILRDPFDLVKIRGDCELFVGSEVINAYSGKWMRAKCAAMKFSLARQNYKSGNLLYNAGIIGGSRKKLLRLFDAMLRNMSDVDLRHNSNMPVFNWCLDNLEFSIFTGPPLHNVFNSQKADEFTYIMHK